MRPKDKIMRLLKYFLKLGIPTAILGTLGKVLGGITQNADDAVVIGCILGLVLGFTLIREIRPDPYWHSPLYW